MPAKKQTKQTTASTESTVTSVDTKQTTASTEPSVKETKTKTVKSKQAATKTNKSVETATVTEGAAATETKNTVSSATTTSTSTVTEDDVSAEDSTDKKSVRKAGRTLLVKSVSGDELNPTMFDGFEGLTTKTETKSTKSYFLTFDTVTNSVNAFRKLRKESPECRVKYSYYRVFFTMNGLVDTTEYNQVKTELTEHVTKQTGANVLYCKLYRKDNKYLGCGDFTIDTLDGMNMLLSKEGTLKEFTLPTSSVTGTFYRFNGKKVGSQNESGQSVSNDQ